MLTLAHAGHYLAPIIMAVPVVIILVWIVFRLFLAAHRDTPPPDEPSAPAEAPAVRPRKQ